MATVVLIGFGSIGRRHAKVLYQNGHDLVILDYQESVREEARNTYPDAKVVANIDDISKNDIESKESAGIIATWAPTHGEYFNSLADMGLKRILCEKPLANSLATAYAMCDRAEAEDIRLIVNHKFRYSDGFDTIRQWESNFDLGEPVHFVSTAGAVGLINKGVHLVDLAFGVFDERPTKVNSTARSASLNPRSDDLGYFGGTSIWKFGDDREAVLSYTNHSSVTQKLQIYYRDALISIDDNYNVSIRHRDQQELEEYPSITRHGLASKELYNDSNPFVESKLEELENAHKDLLADSKPEAPGMLGRDVTEACIGSLIAATEDRSISLPIKETSDYWEFEWSYN